MKMMPVDDTMPDNTGLGNTKRVDSENRIPVLAGLGSQRENIPMPRTLEERVALRGLAKEIHISEAHEFDFVNLNADESVGIIDDNHPHVLYTIKLEGDQTTQEIRKILSQNLITNKNRGEIPLASYFIDFDESGEIVLQNTKNEWDKKERNLDNCVFLTLTFLQDLEKLDGLGIREITNKLKGVVTGILLGSMLTQGTIAAQGNGGGIETQVKVKSGMTLYTLAKTNNSTIDAIKEVNGLESDEIKEGDLLVIPHKNSPSTNTKKESDEAIIHTIVSGNTLYRLSLKYGCTVSQIKAWNDLKSDVLKIGQKLKIYQQKKAYNAVSLKKSENPEVKVTHKVENGDTLYSIGIKYGCTSKDIMRANNLKSELIHPGQTLTIPYSYKTTVPQKKSYPKLQALIHPNIENKPEGNKEKNVKIEALAPSSDGETLHINTVNALLKAITEVMGKLRGPQIGGIPSDHDRFAYIRERMGIGEDVDDVRYANLCAANVRVVYKSLIEHLKRHNIVFPDVWSDGIGSGSGAGAYFSARAINGTLPAGAHLISQVKTHPNQEALEKMLLSSKNDIFILTYDHGKNGHVNIAIRVKINGKETIRIFDPSWTGATQTDDIKGYPFFHNFQDYIASFVNSETILEGTRHVHGAAPGRYTVKNILGLKTQRTQNIHQQNYITDNNTIEIDKIDDYIQQRTTGTKKPCTITGSMILKSAEKYKIPPEFLIAILVNDSNLGTVGKGSTNNNPGNVGQFDHLDAKGITVEGYDTIEEGVDACAENLARRVTAFHAAYPDHELNKEAYKALVTNTGYDGKGFFKYCIGEDNPTKKGAYMTSPIGQKTVPRLAENIKEIIYSDKGQLLAKNS